MITPNKQDTMRVINCDTQTGINTHNIIQKLNKVHIFLLFTTDIHPS